jgi:two-component system, OmpR family, response regulator MprA
MRILVVEDETDLADAVARGLRREGYAVDVAYDGTAALEKVFVNSYDLLCLDVNLPGASGRAVARRVHDEIARGGSEPAPRILMLTALGELEDRVAGLDDGADDYLVKPFDVGELQARLRALLRRSGVNGDATGLVFEELTLDGGRHGVSVGASFVELTRTEYQLLELLMMNAGRVLPHPVIYERVWGYDFGAASNSLRVYVGYLRRKLERAGARPLLHTVRGVGYVLRAP